MERVDHYFDKTHRLFEFALKGKPEHPMSFYSPYMKNKWFKLKRGKKKKIKDEYSPPFTNVVEANIGGQHQNRINPIVTYLDNTYPFVEIQTFSNLYDHEKERFIGIPHICVNIKTLNSSNFEDWNYLIDMFGKPMNKRIKEYYNECMNTHIAWEHGQEEHIMALDYAVFKNLVYISNTFSFDNL